MKPHALLLLHSADPRVYGGGPPLAFRDPGGDWYAFGPDDRAEDFDGSRCEVAVIIAWAGEPVGYRATCPPDVTPRAWCTLILAVLGGLPDGVAQLQEMLSDVSEVLALPTPAEQRACAGPDCDVWTTDPAGCDADPFTECLECGGAFCSDCKSIEGANVHLEDDADRRCAKCTT